MFGTAIDAPLVEETSKGIVLIILFGISYLIAKRFGVLEFNGVTDGIVYGAAVGLGFSFAENIVYLFRGTVDGDLGQGLIVYPPVPPLCNAPPRRHHAGRGAGDRDGAGLAVRRSCPAD